MALFSSSYKPTRKLKRAAIVYDYDGTLAHGNIQENSFLPSIGLNPTEFWQKVKATTKKNDADEILVYMQLMLSEAKAKGYPLTKQMLKAHGQSSQLFSGLKDGSWFSRIKGVNNVWDNEKINAFMPEGERPIPFSRMIFIGDGDTDIPAMKMTTFNGGHSIATYDPERDARTLDKIHGLISDGRADFTAPADFKQNTQMDIMVKGIIGRIARQEGFRPIS